MNRKNPLVIALVTPFLIVSLAACGDDGGDGQDTGGDAAVDPDMTAESLTVRDIAGVGSVYVDSEGRAVYTAEEEKSGEVLCTGACLQIWEPVPASDSATGDFASLTRPDNDMSQLTFQGAPVYTFTMEDAGEVTGNDLTDEFDGTSFTWHVVGAGGVAPSEAPTTSDPGGGYDY